MQWGVEAPISWPDDPDWQRAWSEALHELESWDFDSSGQLLSDGSPRVVLSQGSHLRSGAVYRIGGNTLTLGEVVASIEGPSRELRVTCLPSAQDPHERADLTVLDLDRLDEIEVASTLPDMAVRARLTTRPQTLLSCSVDLPWLAVRLSLVAELTPGQGPGVLRGELDLAGRGLWWPVLAPFVAAASAQIERGLQAVVEGVSETIGMLPSAGIPLSSPLRWSRDPAAAERRIRTGMAELGRRLHAAQESLSGVPWWRRDATRWREAHAALGPGTWPPDNALFLQEWTALDSSAAAEVADSARWRRRWSIDRVVERALQHQLHSRTAFDEEMRRSAAQRASTARPWPTDDDLDLDWLATPWSTIRKLTGVSTDTEAQSLLAQAVAGESGSGQRPTVS